MSTTYVSGFATEEKARKALSTYVAGGFKAVIIGPTPVVSVHADGTDLEWPDADEWYVVVATEDPMGATRPPH